MARNVEIKARVDDLEALTVAVRSVADRGPLELEQRDVFFRARKGRLKLRQLTVLGPEREERAELIAYSRDDTTGPACSRYTRVEVADETGLEQALASTLGREGIVHKRRTVFWAGRTRIHLDRVTGLGDFLELEVVLEPGEEVASGESEAERLLEALGIGEGDLVEVAYHDLLRDRDRVAGGSGRADQDR